MDFDFTHISVPFRMQPGLSRLPSCAQHLTPLDPTSALYQEKLAVSGAGAAQHVVPGFDPTDALASINFHARKAGIRGLAESGCRLELLVKQDLAVFDATTGTVPWMCVCVPSGWAPEDKLGQGLAAIHAPVADNQALAAAWPRLMRLLSGGAQWQRHVWTISPSPRYDQHPRRRAPAVWPQTGDPAEFASQCYLRAEHQTLLPVHDAEGRRTPQAVFTIDVMVEALPSAVRTAEQAQRCHAALQSMTAPILAYKNLVAARAPLLQWLSGLMES